MHRALVVLLALALFASPAGGRAAAQAAAGCAGSWLVRASLAGRDVVEDALVRFDADGALVVSGPPILPALPGDDERPYLASPGLGTWEADGEDGCRFTFVRVLAAEDGVPIGTLFVEGRATATADPRALDGTFDYARSGGTGRTSAEGTGTWSGTPIDLPTR